MPENTPDIMPDILPENITGHPGGLRGRPPERAAGRRVSTVAVHPFLVNRDAVAARFGRHRSIPTHDAVTWPDEQPGAYRGRFHRPELIRFAHLDLSLTGDATGVVVGRVSGFDRVRGTRPGEGDRPGPFSRGPMKCGRRPGPEFVPPPAGRQGSRTVVGGPMLLARPDRRRLAGNWWGGRTMPARGPVSGHRRGSTPPGPL